MLKLGTFNKLSLLKKTNN